ncbi:hypothetical protein PV325_010232 [Microctonus aethiopoides]|uniref:Uncharacterized protein n=1 Tax=Microctonus aethiopoides TaxID=144406 RepID=A0AA39F856_9HYME|nr:hypothetical protein PV325_010232 [Microctonus aethiopoides]KAK0097838.1 hypothetical protein PV326_013327 [Microctonus aethiopoides]KAK0164730.1 hypothetical protein PV328_003319 [Microctonus aethiopoides]
MAFSLKEEVVEECSIRVGNAFGIASELRNSRTVVAHETGSSSSNNSWKREKKKNILHSHVCTVDRRAGTPENLWEQVRTSPDSHEPTVYRPSGHVVIAR